MIKFVAGLLVGSCISIVITSLCAASGRAEEIERNSMLRIMLKEQAREYENVIEKYKKEIQRLKGIIKEHKVECNENLDKKLEV